MCIYTGRKGVGVGGGSPGSARMRVDWPEPSYSWSRVLRTFPSRTSGAIFSQDRLPGIEFPMTGGLLVPLSRMDAIILKPPDGIICNWMGQYSTVRCGTYNDACISTSLWSAVLILQQCLLQGRHVAMPHAIHMACREHRWPSVMAAAQAEQSGSPTRTACLFGRCKRCTLVWGTSEVGSLWNPTSLRTL